MKGVAFKQGQVCILELDGTMVYVEDLQSTHAAVVALPDQPPGDGKRKSVFTAGRVGAKKISPMAAIEAEVDRGALSERNKTFLDTYQELRRTKPEGVNYVDRTPEEQAAYDAQMNPPPKVKKVKGEKGPRRLQRCVKCGEQPGHPKHPGDHEFEAPVTQEPVVLCLACDKPESDHDNNALNHRFVGGKAPRQPRAPKEPRVKEEKAPRESKRPLPGLMVKHRWVEDAVRLEVLRGANPKYAVGNTGNTVIELIRATKDEGCTPLEVVGKPRCPGTPERAQVAFRQLLAAGLLEVVK